MFIDNPLHNMINSLPIKIKLGLQAIILILLIFCLGCASPKLASNMNDSDQSVQVAIVTLGAYLTADRLKAGQREYPVVPH